MRVTDCYIKKALTRLRQKHCVIGFRYWEMGCLHTLHPVTLVLRIVFLLLQTLVDFVFVVCVCFSWGFLHILCENISVCFMAALSICLSICPSISLSISLSICLSVYLSISPHLTSPVCLSIYLSLLFLS